MLEGNVHLRNTLIDAPACRFCVRMSVPVRMSEIEPVIAAKLGNDEYVGRALRDLDADVALLDSLRRTDFFIHSAIVASTRISPATPAMYRRLGAVSQALTWSARRLPASR